MVQILPTDAEGGPQCKRWAYMGEHDLESIKALTGAIEDIAGL
ncbi:hypothetical protein [Natronolimnobius baerhuensis]|nr:hypothetical protein [Natronolimnobius baerhuensis]